MPLRERVDRVPERGCLQALFEEQHAPLLFRDRRRLKKKPLPDLRLQLLLKELILFLQACHQLRHLRAGSRQAVGGLHKELVLLLHLEACALPAQDPEPRSALAAGAGVRPGEDHDPHDALQVELAPVRVRLPFFLIKIKDLRLKIRGNEAVGLPYRFPEQFLRKWPVEIHCHLIRT